MENEIREKTILIDIINEYPSYSIEEAKEEMSYHCYEVDDVVITSEPLKNFPHQENPEIINGVKFHIINNYQVAKGLKRGTLRIAEFGEKLGILFDGEGL